MHTARRSSQAHIHEDEFSDLTLAQAVSKRMEQLGLSPSTPDSRAASASGTDASHGSAAPTFPAHSDSQLPSFIIADGHLRFPHADMQQQQLHEDEHEYEPSSFLVRHGGVSSAPGSFLLPHTSRSSNLSSLATLCNPRSFGWAGPQLMPFGAFGSSLNGGFSAGLRSLQQNTERAATRFRPVDSAAASSSAAAFSPAGGPASHHSDSIASIEAGLEEDEDSSYASLKQEAAAADLRQAAKHLTLGEAMQAMKQRREPADASSMAASSS